MTTVSTAEAIDSLPELITRSRKEQVAIRSDKGDLIYLVPSADVEKERLAKIEAFEKTCRQASAELRASLNADGIKLEDFMAEVMNELH